MSQIMEAVFRFLLPRSQCARVQEPVAVQITSSFRCYHHTIGDDGHFGNFLGNFPNRACRFLADGLDFGDLRDNLPRRLCGLASKRLYLGRHNGEASASCAGSRGRPPDAYSRMCTHRIGRPLHLLGRVREVLGESGGPFLESDQRALQDLKPVRHDTEFGMLTAMGDFNRKIATGQLAHTILTRLRQFDRL